MSDGTDALRIAPAEADDLDAIEALENEGFEYPWSRAAWASELAEDDRLVLVARSDDEVVGVATFQRVVEVADLHRVVVRTDRRGRGIARRLVDAGLAWARSEGVERVMLEVAVDNVAALALYGRFGFVTLARREHYYGPGLHALVMSRDLSGEYLADPADLAVTA